MDDLLTILDSLVPLYRSHAKPKNKEGGGKDEKTAKGKKKSQEKKGPENFSLALAQNKAPSSKETQLKKFKASPDKARYQKNPRPAPGAKGAPYCLLCREEGHFSRACQKFKTAEERQKRVKDQKQCYNCLNVNHELKDCQSAWRCGVCNGRHHTCLHDGNLSAGQVQNAQLQDDPDEESDEDQLPLQLRQASEGPDEEPMRQSRMISFPANFIGEDSDKWMEKGNVFVDGGGGETFIRENCADALNLPTLRTKVKRIGRFGDSEIIKISCRYVSLFVEGVNGHRIKVKAWTIPEPCADLLDIPVFLTKGEKERISKYRILNPPPKAARKVRIDLLVGKDYEAEFLFASKNPIAPINKSLVVHLTPFGNILAGATECKDSGKESLQSLQCNITSLEELEKVFQTEGIESEDSKQLIRAKDQLLIDRFEAQLEFKDGKYYTGLVWKDEEPKLGSNLNAAYRRLAQVVSRLYRTGGEKALLEYDEIFQDYIKRNIIEIVESVDVEKELAILKSHIRSDQHSGENCEICLSDQVYYMMHFDVCKDDAVSSKRRVVMDGSQAVQPAKKSLNETQEKGPNCLQSLPGVIHRTRTSDGDILVSDVEKAYLSVRLKDQEKDKNRILWLRNPSNPSLANNIVVYRYLVVVFGLICSSFILQQVFRIHLNKMGGPLAERLQTAGYVDNVCLGLRKNEDINATYRQTKEMFRSGGFNLRHWASSNKDFNKKLLGQADVHPDLHKGKVGFLGLIYHTETDTYSLKEQKISLDSPMSTKREMVRLIARFGYDPIGFTLPVLMKARLLIQQLWMDGCDWDEQVRKDRSDEMKAILMSLLKLSDIEIDRKIIQEQDSPANLLIFSDASERALAAGVFVWQCVKEKISCNLAVAQGKVASLKPKRTIVQLELNAALMGIRLAKNFVEETKISVKETHLFSDSEIILYQCQTEKKLPKYSQVRVDEIMSANPILHHVEGSLNVSDGPSRGLNFEEVNWKNWLHGPIFVREGKPDDWATFEYKHEMETESEVKLQLATKSSDYSIDLPKEGEARLDIRNFSSLNKALNIRARCRRWIGYKRSENNNRPHFISAQERKKELKQLVQAEQLVYFKEEVKALPKGKSTPLQKQLDLFLDKDGILRGGGRICRADENPDKIHSILIPSKSHLSDLLILHHHRQVGHQRVKATVAEIRRRYWIPGGETKVAQSLKACPGCLQVKGGSLKPPRLGSLPAERLKADRAFQFTGLDHTGEIEVRLDDGGMKGIYILLFTCLVTRAVSLTWTASTSAKDTILAIRRFCALRGTPDVIYSDQATGYIKAKAELAKLGESLAEKMIEWRLQTKRSPWASGVWERLIGSMKKILRHSLWRRRVSLTELETHLAETEGIINSRPLCELSGEGGSGEVLTPAHFLSPSTQLNMPHNWDETEDPVFSTRSGEDNLRKAFASNQKMIKLAWESFQRDYLSILRASQKTFHKAKKGELPWLPRLNGVYLLHEENKGRQQWKRCKVTKLLISDDNVIRFVQILLPSGHVTRRGVKDLYPLEAQIEKDLEDSQHQCPIKKPIIAVKEKEVPKKVNRYDLRPRMNKEQQHNVQLLSNRGLGHKFILLSIIALCALTPVSGSEQQAECTDNCHQSYHQICLSGPGGRVLELPKLTENCQLHESRSKFEEISAKLFVPRTEFPSHPASMCYSETTEVCTSFSFFGGFGLVQPPITDRKPLPRLACLQMNQTREFNGTKLVQAHLLPNHLSTNRSLEVEYKWLTSRHCSSVQNFVMEEGSVSSLDGKNVISSLAYLPNCHIGAGHCETTDSTIIWPTQNVDEDFCDFVSLGIFPFSMNKDLGIIRPLQSAFHLRHRPQPDCLKQPNGSLNGTAEGAFLRIYNRPLVRRRKRDRRTDPINPKLNYVTELIKEYMEPIFLQSHQLFCSLAKRDMENKISIARVDPTIGARGLLRRSDIAAEWARDQLIVHLCHKVNATQIRHDYKFKGICYRMKPVVVTGSSQLWFEAPTGRDLVPFSPKISCHLVNGGPPDGAVVSVPDLHSQLAWNGSISFQPMTAPPLYKSNVQYPASALRILSAHTGPVEARLNGAIIYASKLASDSSSFLQVMEEAGKVIGELQQGQFRLIGSAVESGVEATGKVLHTLSSPLTHLLHSIAYACIAIIVIAGSSFLLYARLSRPSTQSQSPKPITLHTNPESNNFFHNLRRRMQKEQPRQQSAELEETAI